jgi:ribulose-5-phosphate 4-epimerase/fuculose-1-phosphate aldolase
MGATDATWTGRVDLAAALRLAARFGLNEGICNHFSLAVPGTRDRFLINPYGIHWSRIRASDILEVDPAGTVHSGRGEVEATAFSIHLAVHQASPNAACVLHTHMPNATAVTCLESGRLEPVHQNSLRFIGRISYDDDFQGLATDLGEGRRLAEAMAGADICFLAHHGVIVAGPTVARAFDDLYYLERAAEVQVLAMSTGRPLRRVPDAVVRKTAQQFAAEAVNAERHFDALKAILDDEDPRWRS